MKTTLLATVAAASILLVCGQASAADVDMPAADSMGLYVSVFAGASFPQNVKTQLSGTNYSVDLKTGYLLGGAVGVNITDMVRGEVELSHSRWKAKDYSSTGGATGPVSGHMSATYLLANVWLDFENDTAFTPYLGGGAGAGWADANTTFNGNPSGYGDGEMGFAFQLGAGLKYDLTENVSLDLGYRYKSILNVDFESSDGTGDVYEGGDVKSHNVQLGLTYSF
jgi:opacity protein-like surface antigen